jgi:flagellar hook-length control protein FliK
MSDSKAKKAGVKRKAEDDEPTKLSYAQKKAKQLVDEIVKVAQTTIGSAVPYDELLESEAIADGKKEYTAVTEAFAIGFASRLYNAKQDKVAEARIVEKKEAKIKSIVDLFEKSIGTHIECTGVELAAAVEDFKHDLDWVLD